MDAFLVFFCTQTCRPTRGINTLYACCLERQSMTDRTLDISAALREAYLQRLEASLVAKAAIKPATTPTTGKPDPKQAEESAPGD